MNKTKLILITVVVFLFPLFFWGGPDYYSPRSVSYFWNIGHIIFFAATTYLILLQFNNSLSKKSFKFQFTCIISFTFFLGLIIEFAQYGVSRSPDEGDLLKNFTGSFTGLFFFSPSRKLLAQSTLRISQFLIILLLVLATFPVATALLDEWNARKKFPVLADFESSIEISRWAGSADFEIVPDTGDRTNHYLKVTLGTSKYSGVSLKYFPHKWQGYYKLTFKIFNPAPEAFFVTCRIHDREHTIGTQEYSDRFNKRYLVEAGMNDIIIYLEDIFDAPASRKMDSANICGIGIFVTQQNKPRIIYLDDLKLAK